MSPAQIQGKQVSSADQRSFACAEVLRLIIITIQCDGVRPQCSLCVARGRECTYTAEPNETRGSALKRKYSDLEKNMQQLQQAHDSLQGLVDALRFRDQGDVEAVLRRLRQGQDVESIARQIQTGDLLLQMRLSPETRFRHVLPYRSQMPLQLLTAHNPYLNSSLYEATFASPESDMSISILPSSSSSALRRGEHRPQYLKPYVAASIVDPRLDAVKPSAWTTISSDDDLMRKLLSLYFFHEFSWLNCFHKDLFLEDMLSGSTRFCSSLLVNAVLTQACVSLTKHYPLCLSAAHWTIWLVCMLGALTNICFDRAAAALFRIVWSTGIQTASGIVFSPKRGGCGSWRRVKRAPSQQSRQAWSSTSCTTCIPWTKLE